MRGGTPTYTPTDLANDIHAAKVAGMLITHADLQNEPDGHGDNSLNEPNVPPAPPGPLYDMVAKYTEFRSRLDFHGHGTAAAVAANRVWIIGCEWAHFGGFGVSSTFTDHDQMHAAGFVPSKLAFGAGHCYSDCPTPGDYDQRWMLRSIPQNSPFQSNGLWSAETGIFGGPGEEITGTPHPAARMIAALNHGAIVEIAHIGVPRSLEVATTTMGGNACSRTTATATRGTVSAGSSSAGASSPDLPSRSRASRCSDGCYAATDRRGWT